MSSIYSSGMKSLPRRRPRKSSAMWSKPDEN
jgi:hypothetical protein